MLSSEIRALEAELRDYVRVSVANLGQAYNELEERVHVVEEDVNQNVKPGHTSAQPQMERFGSRVSDLEERVGSFEKSQSETIKTLNQLLDVKHQIEFLSPKPGPAHSGLEDIERKLQLMSDRITDVAAVVEETLAAERKHVDALNKDVTTVVHMVQYLDELVRKPGSKQTEADKPTLPEPKRRTSKSAREQTPEPPPPPPPMPSKSVSATDLGRDLLERLQQGETFDRALARILIHALRYATPSKTTLPSPTVSEIRTEQSNADAKPTPPPRTTRSTAAEGPSAGKRLRADDTNGPSKRLRPAIASDPPPAGAATAAAAVSTRARSAAAKNQATTMTTTTTTTMPEPAIDEGSSSVVKEPSATPKSRPRTRSSAAHGLPVEDRSSPIGPRRTSRTSKPTERAKDLRSRYEVAGF